MEEVAYREHLKRICKASLRYPEDHGPSGLIKKKDLLPIPSRAFSTSNSPKKSHWSLQIKTIKSGVLQITISPEEKLSNFYDTIRGRLKGVSTVRVLRQGRVIPDSDAQLSEYIPDPSIPLHAMEIPRNDANGVGLQEAFYKDLEALLAKHGVEGDRAKKLITTIRDIK